jgi:putative flippase GtrA
VKPLGLRLTITRARFFELARYGVVGITLVVTEYVLYLAIISLAPQAALPAYIASRFVAGIVGFVGHARFSFGRADMSVASGVRYALATAANMLLSSWMLTVVLPIVGPILGKMVSDCVGVATGYFSSRYIIFVSAHKPGTPP